MSERERRLEQVTVIGLGAMGTMLAVKFAAAGYPVRGVVRGRTQAATIAAHGLHLTLPGGDHLTARPAAVVAIEDVPDLPRAQSSLVIIAVKSYSTSTVAAAILPMLAPETLVLTLQNGLGNAEALIAAGVHPAQLLLGVTTDGATSVAPGASEQRGQGTTKIGPYQSHKPPDAPGPGGRTQAPSGSQATVLEAFAKAGLAVEWHEDMSPHVWTKLAVNAAINPITALLGVRNGDLVDLPDMLAVMRAVVVEVEDVARARGVIVPTGGAWPVVEAVLARTTGNRSSMLQDRLAGRPTEIDSICGALVTEGRRLGVATPIIQCLHALVTAASRLTWGPGGPP